MMYLLRDEDAESCWVNKPIWPAYHQPQKSVNRCIHLRMMLCVTASNRLGQTSQQVVSSHTCTEVMDVMFLAAVQVSQASSWRLA